ncbi:MAG: FPC/CPF motif-containing protein YcgG [Hydrogenophaga sp.]|jgi:FPC/CPF motif-containing protein YcgG
MKSVASHSGRHATARNNPLAVCPHVVDVQGLTQVDPASPSNAAGDLFSSYVLERSTPCVMARCMVNRKQVFLASCGELGDADRCADVYHDLHEVLAASEADSSLYSLLAVSPSQASHMEKAFARALWDQLNGIHQVDRNLFFWGSCVSQDPADPKLSFSVGGTAWYVVGLHPGASRSSRQFAVPTLISNRHAQFSALR